MHKRLPFVIGFFSGFLVLIILGSIFSFGIEGFWGSISVDLLYIGLAIALFFFARVLVKESEGLSGLAGLLMLFFTMLLLILNGWQQSGIEKAQLEIRDEIRTIQKRIAAGMATSGRMLATRNTTTSNGAVPQAQDDSNLLQPDPDEWLPIEAETGGTFIGKLSSDPKGLNYLIENGADVSRLQAYNHISLMRRHLNDISKFSPELAYYMGRSDDYLTYTFKIRDDIFWHEPTVSQTKYPWLFDGSTCRKGHFVNGRCRVTAHDLQFMMEMLMNDQVAGAAPMRSYYGDLDSYKALDDFTFEVKFKKKSYTNDTTIRGLYPVPEFLYAYNESGTRYGQEIIGSKLQEHWYNPKAMGAGPYRFIEFESGVKLVFEKDPLYPLGGNAFDKLIFKIVKEQIQGPIQLIRGPQKGGIHITDLPPSQYRQYILDAKTDSEFNNNDIKDDKYWTHTFYYIGWNQNKPLFKDKRVRWAMSHAFNGDMILKDVLMGLGRRCTGPIPAHPDLPFYNKELPVIKFDLERAAELLEEAGWQDSNGDGIRDKIIDGERVSFKFSLIIYGSSKEYKTIGDIYKEDLSKIGVEMTVQPLEWSMLLKNIDDREFDAVTLAWVSGPSVDFRQIWHSKQADEPKSSNYIGFRNAEADKIIEELSVAFDHDKRVELAHRFHELVYEEQPYTFFYTKKQPYAWRSELQNAVAQQIRPYLNIRPWYISSEGGE